MSTPVDLSLIRTDGGTQPRAAIDTQLVETYAEDMANGATFPPLVVFFDGVAHWLADGFHRFYAARGCGLAEFECDLRQGTVRDAILFSVSANAVHGLRRTNEDKRRAVLTLLNDEKWAAWSDREIARHCRVSPTFVGANRPADTVHVDSMERTFVHPKTRQPTPMRTENIGRRAEPDRPVFDNTDAGRDTRQPAASAPAPTSAPTPQQVQSVRDDWEAGRGIATDLRMIMEAMSRLPAPHEAAGTFPRALRHTINPQRARAVGDWFAAFAAAWEHENGDANVAA